MNRWTSGLRYAGRAGDARRVEGRGHVWTPRRSVSARAPCCRGEDERDPGQGEHRLGHRGSEFLLPPPETWVRRELSPPCWLSFVLSLSSSRCALVTARGGEELEIDSHEGFLLPFRTELSPSLLLSFHLFCHLPLFSFLHAFSGPKPFPQAQPSSPFCPSPPCLFCK